LIWGGEKRTTGGKIEPKGRSPDAPAKERGNKEKQLLRKHQWKIQKKHGSCRGGRRGWGKVQQVKRTTKQQFRGGEGSRPKGKEYFLTRGTQSKNGSNPAEQLRREDVRAGDGWDSGVAPDKKQ